MTMPHLLPSAEGIPPLGEMDTVFKLAQFVAQSGFFPAWKGKPHDAAVAILFGQSVRLSWGHSLLNIAVINGRPTVWGDAMLALCKKAPTFEYCHETFDEQTMTAFCAVKRKGEKEQVRTFSQKDAQQAGLWGKKDNWIKYPRRMLQMRARAFALRDVFPDVLHGLGCTEEVQDYPDSAKTKMGSNIDANIVPFPPAVETLPKQAEEEVLTHTPQKEASPELQQFVDSLAKFNKGDVIQTPMQPKTAFTLMRERLDEQRHHQQQKGIDAVERLKTLMPALQQGKGS
jgi:hypothetical protein